MPKFIAAALIGLAAGTAMTGAATASDIRVQPVTVEPLAGARTSSLTLINEEARPVRVQMRVMRWTQGADGDRLSPTSDVVASPPFTTLAPGQQSMVRLVRTAAGPIRGEESYRVLVDEVPEPGDARPGTVNLVLRQSIPVFFSDLPQRASVVDWSVARADGRMWLVAHNTGGRRLRLSDLSIEDHDEELDRQPGLVGYVLPGATMRWAIDAHQRVLTDPSLRMRAVSDTGLLEVSLVDAPGS
jgi:fimbrial chaperone protein